MSVIDEDFRTLLAANAPGGTTIEKGTISEEQIPTRVYYQRSAATTDLFLDKSVGITESVFDVEVATLNDDATTQSIAAQIKTALNGYQGTTGSTGVLATFVADHADDYQPRGVDADDGYTVAAFQVTVHSL